MPVGPKVKERERGSCLRKQFGDGYICHRLRIIRQQQHLTSAKKHFYTSSEKGNVNEVFQQWNLMDSFKNSSEALSLL